MPKRKPVVTVQLVGGVGNQLFQYYAGKYVAINNNASLKLDISRIGIGGTNHGSSIFDFALDEVAVYSKIRNLFLQSIFGRTHNYLMRNSNLYATSMKYFINVYHSPELGYDPVLAELTAPVRLSGYFQTSFYFQSLTNSGVKKPKLKFSNQWFESTLSAITNNESLIIHIRRGDYILLKTSFGLLSKNYYESAVRRIREEFHFTDVFIFSDDIQTAKELNLRIEGAALHYVIPPSESRAVESIMLMSAGKGMILSNSTFAWWSAVLGQIEHVVCPSEWFKNLTPPKNLALTSWKLIKSDWES